MSNPKCIHMCVYCAEPLQAKMSIPKKKQPKEDLAKEEEK